MTISVFIGRMTAFARSLFSNVWWAECQFKGVTAVSRPLLLGRPLVSIHPGSKITLGENVRIHSALRSNPMGCFQPSVLRTMSPGAQLSLGRGVGVSATVIIAGKSISIGEGTTIGAGAIIIDNDFHAPDGEYSWKVEYIKNAKAVVIGKGVFIGTRAIILKGVTIGDHAVIGAGAVVSKNIPAGMLATGNPAVARDRGPLTN